MTFEDFDYVELDYDTDEFTIYKDGHEYTYSIDDEFGLYTHIIGEIDPDKFEVYSQEEDYEEEIEDYDR